METEQEMLYQKYGLPKARSRASDEEEEAQRCFPKLLALNFYMLF